MLSEQKKKEIRASKNSVEYLAWQYGVDVKTIRKILAEPTSKPEKKTEKKAET